MSLVSFVGPRPNLLDINNVNPPLRLELSQPILGFEEMAKMRSIERYTDENSVLMRLTQPTLPNGEEKALRLALPRCALVRWT